MKGEGCEEERGERGDESKQKRWGEHRTDLCHDVSMTSLPPRTYSKKMPSSGGRSAPSRNFTACQLPRKDQSEKEHCIIYLLKKLRSKDTVFTYLVCWHKLVASECWSVVVVVVVFVQSWWREIDDNMKEVRKATYYNIICKRGECGGNIM